MKYSDVSMHTLCLILYITLDCGLWLHLQSILKSNIFLFYNSDILLMSYQECCVATCKPFCFAVPDDGCLMLKHVGISNVMYDF